MKKIDLKKFYNEKKRICKEHKKEIIGGAVLLTAGAIGGGVICYMAMKGKDIPMEELKNIDFDSYWVKGTKIVDIPIPEHLKENMTDFWLEGNLENGTRILHGVIEHIGKEDLKEFLDGEYEAFEVDPSTEIGVIFGFPVPVPTGD